jgi:cytochrome c peroxidase
LPGNLNDFVKDIAVAIRLGKALFWDVQVGSNGKTACATCHYNAGVDNRSNDNTVHPGANGVVNTSLPLNAADFPFGVANDDVIGSQGVPAADFIGLILGSHVDVCNPAFPNGNTLQKTGRQSPNMIMAIFNRDNFWDGRAKREFNGVTPGGAGTGAKIWVNGASGLVQQEIILQPASQASQEVGPPLNGVEMSCALRTFGDLGRKMINNNLDPLEQQFVATDDGTLGDLSNFPAKGLNTTYKALIKAAFHDHLTSDDPLPDASGFTQIEANFSLFWGLSIMLYGSTLIPDDTRYDRFAEGTGALTAQELTGLAVFNGKGRCAHCHSGAEFTAASIVNGNNGQAFANIGVRPTAEDGGRQPENKGKFKTPTLRNTELTGPYFHTGGYLTLRQVVDFYNQGGNFNNKDKDSQIRPLGLTEADKNALVAFILTLTDERVRCERKPFDHPSIDIPNGPSITEVGENGRPAGQCLKWFLNANPFAP